MLFVGFGFLMTFLPRFGYSAVCFTMIITVCCVEWGILITGFLNMDHDTMTIPITWLRYDHFIQYTDCQKSYNNLIMKL